MVMKTLQTPVFEIAKHSTSSTTPRINPKVDEPPFQDMIDEIVYKMGILFSVFQAIFVKDNDSVQPLNRIVPLR
jgi:hypothetical protein